MTMRPEDVAAFFDLPPPEPESASDEARAQAAAAAEAAEAALAAEWASEIGSGALATDAPDSRTNSRVAVTWTARLRLAGGEVIELAVRNVSATGVGLSSRQPVPADTVVDFELDVPPPDARGEPTPVRGTLRTTYASPQGADMLFGGAWVRVAPADLAPVHAWIARLGAR